MTKRHHLQDLVQTWQDPQMALPKNLKVSFVPYLWCLDFIASFFILLLNRPDDDVHLFICDLGMDDALFSIMDSICCLVDTIPEHELIAMNCGSELLLQRARR